MTHRVESRTSLRRRVAATVVLLVVATTVVACQNGKVGGKCKVGTVAQDKTHVLHCPKGRWVRMISKADGLRELARIQAEEEAKKRAAATTAPPVTTPPTEPPATAAPTTAPVVTVPPTTAPPATTTTTAPPTTTSTTVAPTTTTTTVPATTTTHAPTTTSTIPTTTSSTTTTTTIPATTTTLTPTTTTTVPSTTAPTTTGTTTTTVPPASDDDLDTSFGTNGRFKLDLPTQGENVLASATSPGGTTYLMLADNSGPGLAPIVRKVLASGDVDTSFGTNGIVRGPSASCYLCSLGVDDQNRLYVWGNDYAPTASQILRIARYNDQGTPDATYGPNGIVTVSTSFNAVADLGPTGWFVVGESWTPRVTTVSPTGVSHAGFGGGVCLIFDVAVDAAGGSVIGSTNCPQLASTATRVARMTNQGELVTTFGTHDAPATDYIGTATLNDTQTAGVRALALDSQGRTYVVNNREVRRLTADGQRDTSYNGGVAMFPTIGGSENLVSVTVVGDRLHGLLSNDTRATVGTVVSRLTTTGTPDASYGNGGVAVLAAYLGAASAQNYAYGNPRLLPSGSGVIVQSNLGITDAHVGRLFVNALVQLRGNGQEESAYGTNGLSVIRKAPVAMFLRNSFPGPSGSIYAHLALGPTGEQSLVRVTAAGALDTSFSGDGWMPVDESVMEMTVDLAGRPVVFRATMPEGSMSFGGQPSSLERSITRYTTAGVPDTSFHTGDGTVTWPTATYPSGSSAACDGRLTALTDNSIVVRYPNQGASTVCSTVFDKVSATGTLTQGWGVGYSTFAGTDRMVDQIKPAPNGRAIVLARSTAGGGVAPRILRLNSVGTADGTFGAGGGWIDVTDGAVVGQIESLSDGSVLVASATATAMSYPGASAWIRRYSPDGTQVTTGGFGPSGTFILDPAQHLTVANGRIVGGGWKGTGHFSVLREDATYDTSFPNAGNDGRSVFGGGLDRDVYAVVSNSRGFAVTASTDGQVEIFKLRGTIG